MHGFHGKSCAYLSQRAAWGLRTLRLSISRFWPNKGGGFNKTQAPLLTKFLKQSILLGAHLWKQIWVKDPHMCGEVYWLQGRLLKGGPIDHWESEEGQYMEGQMDSNP